MAYTVTCFCKINFSPTHPCQISYCIPYKVCKLCKLKITSTQYFLCVDRLPSWIPKEFDLYTLPLCPSKIKKILSALEVIWQPSKHIQRLSKLATSLGKGTAQPRYCFYYSNGRNFEDRSVHKGKKERRSPLLWSPICMSLSPLNKYYVTKKLIGTHKAVYSPAPLEFTAKPAEY